MSLWRQAASAVGRFLDLSVSHTYPIPRHGMDHFHVRIVVEPPLDIFGQFAIVPLYIYYDSFGAGIGPTRKLHDFFDKANVQPTKRAEYKLLADINIYSRNTNAVHAFMLGFLIYRNAVFRLFIFIHFIVL
jgi:hypothetical protein